MNSSVEFNLETLSPTYHLTIGLPGRSNALEIAQRLGMPPELIDEARTSIAPEQRQVEEMLSDIKREREGAASARRAEEIARREAEEIRGRLADRLDAAEDERARLLEQTSAQVNEQLGRTQQLLAEAEAHAEQQQLEAAAAKLKLAEEETHKLEQQAAQRTERRRRQPAAAQHPAPAGPPPTSIRTGDMVWLRGMDQFGEALSAPDARGEVELRLGPLRSRIKLTQVERVQRPAPSRARGAVTTDIEPPRDVPPEIEVRGHTVDEAIPAVEQYIDDAFRAGLSSARIIHGKGTGTLRRQVRDYLGKHPLVKSYEEARREEGGEGVTIAHLAL